MPTAGEEMWWHLHTKWTANVAARRNIWNCVRWYTSPTHSPPSAWNSCTYRSDIAGSWSGDIHLKLVWAHSTHPVAIVWHDTTHRSLKEEFPHLQSIEDSQNWKPFSLSSYGLSVAEHQNHTKKRWESTLLCGHGLNNYVCLSVRGRSLRLCHLVLDYKRPHVGKGGQNVTMMFRFLPSSTNKLHVITLLLKWLWIHAKVVHVLFLWRCNLAKL